MPSLTAKDRISFCLFNFTDGRRCRTPCTASHPHFCFYHAQKESQSQTAEKLAKDLTYFFSGDYLSANDLNTALCRLIPAVIRGANQTPRRPHRRLHGPNTNAVYPPIPRRIHQRLRHRRLARSRPHLRHRQPRLPLPARPQRPRRRIRGRTRGQPRNRLRRPTRHPRPRPDLR